jgi:serine/threonine protein kinase
LRRPAPFKTLASAAFGGRYTVGRYLGRGASATVWEAVHSDSDFRVAVKVFDQGSRDRRQAAREMKVLSRIRHPRVLEVFEVIESTLYSQLICELIEGESLRAFAQKQPFHRLQEGLARNFYQQVVEGVTYCHERLVVHRDLKLENLLLDRSQENVKIIDFGFAAQTTSKDVKLRAFCGTPSYMAPEIIRGEGYSGFAADVWALGVVIFTLIAGALPFAGRTELQLYAKIRRGVFSFPDIIGEPIRRLVRACMKMDPTSRPAVTSILRNSWVSNTAERPATATSTTACSITSGEPRTASAADAAAGGGAPGDRLGGGGPSRVVEGKVQCNSPTTTTSTVAPKVVGMAANNSNASPTTVASAENNGGGRTGINAGKPLQRRTSMGKEQVERTFSNRVVLKETGEANRDVRVNGQPYRQFRCVPGTAFGGS